jgi:hypothetical protein
MLLSLLRQGPDVVDTDLSKYFGTSKHILAKRHVCQITGVQAREPEAEAALPVRVAQPLRPLPAPSTTEQGSVGSEVGCRLRSRCRKHRARGEGSFRDWRLDDEWPRQFFRSRWHLRAVKVRRRPSRFVLKVIHQIPSIQPPALRDSGIVFPNCCTAKGECRT